ncbi:hypothetical protein [Diaphorobacter caeni]|uniref:hypothetical protein n=1 Tax=Diaphorobacter caeni TaxID=2784387 RepID=UPI00188FCCE3|nr:hypothetical protein [Diaphorobacter caeni]
MNTQKVQRAFVTQPNSTNVTDTSAAMCRKHLSQTDFRRLPERSDEGTQRVPPEDFKAHFW